MITVGRMIALAPEANRMLVAAVAPLLDAAATRREVTTPLRWAHLVGQMAEETNHFLRLDANMKMQARHIARRWPQLAARAQQLALAPQSLANAAYAGLGGNGNEASGDGWRFRRRGLLPICGRDRYEAAAEISGIDLMNDPDRALDPDGAVTIALALWHINGCDALADADDCDAIATALCGVDCVGRDERRALVAIAKEIFTE